MQTVSRRKIAQHISTELAAGKPVGPLMSQAAAYLIEHKALAQTDLLVRDIEATIARDHGVVLAKIVSARELSAQIIKSIEVYVKRAEGAKQVEVSATVDPSLLGGVIIKTPRAEMDISIRKQLNELRV